MKIIWFTWRNPSPFEFYLLHFGERPLWVRGFLYLCEHPLQKPSNIKMELLPLFNAMTDTHFSCILLDTKPDYCYFFSNSKYTYWKMLHGGGYSLYRVVHLCLIEGLPQPSGLSGFWDKETAQNEEYKAVPISLDRALCFYAIIRLFPVCCWLRWVPFWRCSPHMHTGVA